MRIAAQQLVRLPEVELDLRMRGGRAPRIEALVGWEFRGFNVPAVTGLLGFQKFKKGFYLRPDESAGAGCCHGYNVLVAQNELHEPWLAKPSEGMPKRHGFYDVAPVSASARHRLYPNALLIDYGVRENSRVNPERLIRDYLVQPDPSDPDVLLGFATIALGFTTVRFGFFVLDRDQPPVGFTPPSR
ncbi:MAG: hypothetical protein U0610_01985 [bacterium]